MKRYSTICGLALVAASPVLADETLLTEPVPDQTVMRPSHQVGAPKPDDHVIALARLAWVCTNDPSPQRRAAAVMQIGRFSHDVKRASSVLQAVQRNEKDPHVRQLASQASMQLKLEAYNQSRVAKSAEATPPVSPRIHDNRPYREALAEVLRIRGPMDPNLLEKAAASQPAEALPAPAPVKDALVNIATPPAAEKPDSLPKPLPEPLKENPATDTKVESVAKPEVSSKVETEVKSELANAVAEESPKATQQGLVEKVESSRKSASSSLPTVDNFTDPAEKAKLAREWVQRGREALSQGRMEDAEGALQFVNFMDVPFGVFEYGPKALERDIRKAKSRSN